MKRRAKSGFFPSSESRAPTRVADGAVKTFVAPLTLLLETSFKDPELKKIELAARRVVAPSITLVKLREGNRVLLYYGACETKVWDLTESHCLSFTDAEKGLPFSEREGTVSLSWESVDSKWQDTITGIVQSVQKIEEFASTVGKYYRENKKHQAFALLYTAVYMAPYDEPDYRNVYRSKIHIESDKRGELGIGLDMIWIAIEANLDAYLAYTAIRIVWEEVASSLLTKDMLNPAVFGLSGCDSLSEDGMVLDVMKVKSYLSSLEPGDITEANVVFLAKLAFDILCGDSSLIGTTAAFSIFNNERLVGPCLESDGFKISFNKKINSLSEVLGRLGRDYPEIIFIIIHQAYIKGQIKFACKENVLLQILKNEKRCVAFADSFDSICDDIIANNLFKAAKAILECKHSIVIEFVKTLPADKREGLETLKVPSDHRPAALPVALDSRLLVTPARATTEVEANSRIMVDKILGLIRPHLSLTKPLTRRVGNDIDCLCKMVVLQYSREREKMELLRILAGDGEIRESSEANVIMAMVESLRRKIDSMMLQEEWQNQAAEEPLKTAWECLMVLLKRPILVLEHQQIKYWDYELRGRDDDLERIRTMATRSDRPIVVLADDLPSKKTCISGLIKDYDGKKTILFPDVTPMGLNPKYNSLWHNLTIMTKFTSGGDERDVARKNNEVKTQIISWVRVSKESLKKASLETESPGREVLSILLVYEETGKWCIYGKHKKAGFLEGREILSESVFGRMLYELKPELDIQLREKKISREQAILLQARQLREEGILLEQAVSFLEGDLRLLPPPEPLFAYLPDRSPVDYCERVLERFGTSLKDRLEHNISITQAFLMLQMNFVIRDLKMPKLGVRLGMGALTPDKRMEIVNTILDEITRSSYYGHLVVREAAASASSSVVRSLGLG